MSKPIFEEIICITTNGSRDHCKHIAWVKTSSGQPYSVKDVIRLLTLGTHVFYVDDKKNDVALVKAVPEKDPYYIRTKADDTKEDNLLQLDECPNEYRY